MSLAAGALLFFSTVSPARGTGAEGCYEARSPGGWRYELKIRRIYSDADVGMIYDLHIRVDGKTVLHRHALMSSGDQGQCFMETPEAELDDEHLFYFSIGIATIANEPISTELCHAGAFDLTAQLTGDEDDLDNYIEFGVGDAFTGESNSRDSALLRRPKPQFCSW